VPPDVVFEVRSPTDQWPEILRKVSEYLTARVRAVCVLDEQTEKIHVYDPDEPPRILGADEELTLPAPLDGFRVAVRRFFA
jgi:Uma2 family endonuclease